MSGFLILCGLLLCGYACAGLLAWTLCVASGRAELLRDLGEITEDDE